MLLRYLREVAQHSVDVRSTAAPRRGKSKPRNSAAQQQEEARQKVWEDVVAGRAWLVSSDRPELDGVLEAPQGRVPKQLPDRTLSTEGRFIND